MQSEHTTLERHRLPSLLGRNQTAKPTADTRMVGAREGEGGALEWGQSGWQRGRRARAPGKERSRASLGAARSPLGRGLAFLFSSQQLPLPLLGLGKAVLGSPICHNTPAWPDPVWCLHSCSWGLLGWGPNFLTCKMGIMTAFIPRS